MKSNRALLDAINDAVEKLRNTGAHQRVIEVRLGEYHIQDHTKPLPAGAKTRWTTYKLTFRESLDA
jgi:hypothetical protein